MKQLALMSAVVVGFVTTSIVPVVTHHSFAMYDQTITKTVTGKLTRYVPGANHAQLIFHVLGPDGAAMLQDGKPVQWGVETGSAAAMARLGVSPTTFPEGTVFTVRLYPLRDGRNFGALAGMLIKCGAALPPGGCTKETGQSLVGESFSAQ